MPGNESSDLLQHSTIEGTTRHWISASLKNSESTMLQILMKAQKCITLGMINK